MDTIRRHSAGPVDFDGEDEDDLEPATAGALCGLGLQLNPFVMGLYTGHCRIVGRSLTWAPFSFFFFF